MFTHKRKEKQERSSKHNSDAPEFLGITEDYEELLDLSMLKGNGSICSFPLTNITDALLCQSLCASHSVLVNHLKDLFTCYYRPNGQRTHNQLSHKCFGSECNALGTQRRTETLLFQKSEEDVFFTASIVILITLPGFLLLLTSHSF